MAKERETTSGGRKIPQAFPYQGSKRLLAPAILQYLPRRFGTFWEPFAGSAAMTLAVAAEGRAAKHVINDVNEPLARLWRRILEEPDALADGYKAIWSRQLGREMEFFGEVREAFNARRGEEELLFLLARCVKAAVRYNAKGEFNQSADRRRRGMKPATMRGNLLRTARLLEGRTRVCSMDFRRLVEEADVDDVIYMDPPYQGVSGYRDGRYAAGLGRGQFVESLRELEVRGLSFAVSYDGRSGGKGYGEPLPRDLGMELVEIEAGRSSQATLLGRSAVTVESLYLSRRLVERLRAEADSLKRRRAGPAIPTN